MAKRPWAYQPSLHKETLEHFFTSKAPLDLPCTDEKAAFALRHALHRYYVQTANEAQAGNPDATRLAVIIPEIMVTKRDTVIVVSLRADRINVDFEKMAEAVARQRELKGTTMEDLKKEVPAGKKKGTYY